MILLSHEKISGWWLVPGGGLEIGETPEEVARREIKEETGLTAEKLELIGAIKRLDSHPVIYAYLAVVDCEKDSVCLQERETIGYQWVGTSTFFQMIQNEPILKLQYPRYKPYLDTLGEQEGS